MVAYQFEFSGLRSNTQPTCKTSWHGLQGFDILEHCAARAMVSVHQQTLQSKSKSVLGVCLPIEYAAMYSRHTNHLRCVLCSLLLANSDPVLMKTL